MGVIKKIFSGILAFIQGLFGGLAKTAGLGKSQYFMELSDDDSVTSDGAVPPAKPKAPAPAKTTSNGSAAPTSNGTSPSPAPSAAKKAKAEVKTVKEDADLDIIKPTSDPTQSIQSPAQPRAEKPAASTVAVASSAAKATADGAKNGSTTFAPNFLLNRSTTGGRRRPGPSLNPFKDMVRDMNSAG